MEKTKKFLNVAIGISLILTSISVLIFSTKHNTANAQIGTKVSSDVVVAGTVLFGTKYFVIGYNTATKETSILGMIPARDMKFK